MEREEYQGFVVCKNDGLGFICSKDSFRNCLKKIENEYELKGREKEIIKNWSPYLAKITYKGIGYDFYIKGPNEEVN